MKSAVALLSLLFVAAAAGGDCPATDRDKARWTHADMMSWKTALAAYKIDNGSYPAAKTLDDLRAAVQPKYMMHAPMKDAWGVAYAIEPTAGGYTIISAGADGKFERDTWSTRGKSGSYADDAVVSGDGPWLFRYWDLSK